MKSKSDVLNEKILLLKNTQATQLKLLTQQLDATYQSLRPINLLKTTLHEVATAPELKTTLINNAIGLTMGYLSKKIITGSSHNPMIKMGGLLLQFTIANIASKHPEAIKAAGKNIFKIFFDREDVKD